MSLSKIKPHVTGEYMAAECGDAASELAHSLAADHVADVTDVIEKQAGQFRVAVVQYPLHPLAVAELERRDLYVEVHEPAIRCMCDKSDTSPCSNCTGWSQASPWPFGGGDGQKRQQ